jgi:hypothetical protein
MDVLALELEGVVPVLVVVVVNALVPTETSSVELATEALVAEVEILEREIGLVGRVPQPCFRSTARPALTAIDGRKQLIRQQERASYLRSRRKYIDSIDEALI